MTKISAQAAIQAEITALAERLWTPGVTHLSISLPVRGYLGTYGVRAAGRGWMGIPAVAYAPVDGSRLRLAELLADLTTAHADCDALAVEDGGRRARLALYPVPGQREDARQAAYTTGTTLEDADAHRARQGGRVVAEFLRRETEQPATDAADQVRQGEELAALHQRLTNGSGLGEPTQVIAGAVSDVLHHGDGWAQAPVILDRAFGLHWTSLMPEQRAKPAQYGTDTHGLDALAGTVAALFAAAAIHEIPAEDIADRAEESFADEIEDARYAAVRSARS
ncbi:hypothetical protein [Streptomyces sp. NPDC001297]|uniref:hypothetical protein n=1 Tax=Streptomyces sp. NPDC001297 TaxID=3364559 RepID=UPI0036BFC850